METCAIQEAARHAVVDTVVNARGLRLRDVRARRVRSAHVLFTKMNLAFMMIEDNGVGRDWSPWMCLQLIGSAAIGRQWGANTVGRVEVRASVAPQRKEKSKRKPRARVVKKCSESSVQQNQV